MAHAQIASTEKVPPIVVVVVLAWIDDASFSSSKVLILVVEIELVALHVVSVCWGEKVNFWRVLSHAIVRLHPFHLDLGSLLRQTQISHNARHDDRIIGDHLGRLLYDVVLGELLS